MKNQHITKNYFMGRNFPKSPINRNLSICHSPANRPHSPHPNSEAKNAASSAVPFRCSSLRVFDKTMPFINRLSVNAILRFSSSHLYFLVQIPDKPFNIFFVENSQNYSAIAFNHIEHPVLVHPEPVII